jgi:glycosyltransferase involved in cell wall biosynthesis
MFIARDALLVGEWFRMQGKCRVSIGLPVSNGEKYLKAALDSFLVQTFPHFEVIISDNASTDRTKEICLAYQAKDSRFRYFRNEKNIGSSRNYNRVFMLSSGEYFKWAANDDVIAPQFLDKCVRVLDQDPSIALCCSKAHCIDENGQLISNKDYEMSRMLNINISSRKANVRFGALLSLLYPMSPIFGIIRKSALEKTSLMTDYIGSDRNLLAEIGLAGRIYEIPEYLFFYRIHSQSYTDISPWWEPDCEVLSAWWSPGNTQRIIFAYNILEYFRSVRRIPLSCSEKLLCYAQIAHWFAREGWMALGIDVKISLLRRLKLGLKLDSALKILGPKYANLWKR